MLRYFLGAALVVLGAVSLLQACGPGDGCEVTLTCEAPTGGSTADGGTGGTSAGGEGGTEREEGAACTDAPQCASGFCVDGVCCASACDGTCEGCDATGACVPRAAATDPDDECAAAAVCDGSGACAEGTHQFSTMWGDTDVGVWVRDVAVDGDGNVYVVGWFTDDFLVGGTETLVAQANDNAWIAKFDSSGNYLWSRAYGTATSNHNISSVVTDVSGSVVIVGSYSGAPGLFLSACGGSATNFVAKLDGQGQTQWCKRIPSKAYVASASNGDVVLAGEFLGTVDFGAPTSPQVATNNGIYVLRVGPLGNPQWAVSFDNVNSQYVDDVGVDATGGVTLVGRFSTSASFGGAPVTSVMSGLYAARFQPTGEPVWAKGFGDDVFRARGTVDAEGRVLVSGRFNGSIDFGGGPVVANGADGFIAALAADGGYLWALHATGSGVLYEPTSTTWDARGNAIVSAQFQGDLDLEGTPHSAAGAGMLIAKVAFDGTQLWSHSWSCDEHNDAGVATDASGNVWWGGDYFGTIDLGGGDLVSDSENAFLVKFSP